MNAGRWAVERVGAAEPGPDGLGAEPPGLGDLPGQGRWLARLALALVLAGSLGPVGGCSDHDGGGMSATAPSRDEASDSSESVEDDDWGAIFGTADDESQAEATTTAATEDDDGDVEEYEGSCSTSLDPGQNATFVRLCQLAAPVRHVRLEGLIVPKTHAAFQVFLGFEQAPHGPQDELLPGQFKLLMYGGGNPAPSPQVVAEYAGVGRTLDEQADDLAQPTSWCFDLDPGTATQPPRLVLWRDGQAGADCADWSSLSLSNALGVVDEWDDLMGSIAHARAYARQSQGPASPVVTLFDSPAL